MHIRTDDDLARVDQTWLGPKGADIIAVFRWSYAQWGLALAAFLATLWGFSKFDSIDVASFVWAMLAAYVAASITKKIFSVETPMHGVAQAAISEITQPRRNAKSQTFAYTAKKKIILRR